MKLMPDFSKVSRRKLIWSGLAVIVVVFFATLPFYYDVHNGQFGIFFFIVFIYGIVAQGWNLVAGYTGQISLGQNAFFGLGAFTMALLWVYDVTKTGYWFDPVLMILSGVTPIILAVLVGLPLLSRLRGDYFSFGTLGMGMIVYGALPQRGRLHRRERRQAADQVHARGRGVQLAHPLLRSSSAWPSSRPLVVYFMTTSRIGLALKAIREDEVSAASHGINVLKYKIIAFAVAASLAGMAGSLYSYYLLHLMPMNVFTQNWLFIPILMVVLGGTGTIIGPWIGSLVIYAIAWYGDKYFAGWHPVILGVIIILVMLFLPSGIVGLGAEGAPPVDRGLHRPALEVGRAGLLESRLVLGSIRTASPR